MDDNRTEQAIQRIEAALARIARVAEALPAQVRTQAETDSMASPPATDATEVPPSVSQLVVRHEALREEIAGQIRRIDELVGKFEQ
ncbi:hypothetical protein [Altererythrobacter sp. MTPC7]|uniref:hypothetical protein n=1 Tax=Altererythrobacter sp. MTPC7 TaxID=3056567 RepID=UPI0036F3CB54